jgi:hypothetical protein
MTKITSVRGESIRIRLSPVEKADLEQLAADAGLSVSAWVRMMIKQELKKNSK